jgi:hypothetical protein
MAFAVSSFQSALSGGGARPSLFNLTITGVNAGGAAGSAGGGLESLHMLCSATSLPGLTVTPIERTYFGRVTKIPGDMVFADLTTTIILDEDYAPRNQIEQWMADMNSHETNERAIGNGMGSEGATGKLKQFSKGADSSAETVAAVHIVNFVDIFPTTLSEVALSYDTVSEISSFEVTWAYQYYTIDSGTK